MKQCEHIGYHFARITKSINEEIQKGFNVDGVQNFKEKEKEKRKAHLYRKVNS